jgi:DNA-binding NarL/FixJ family response regulator
MQPVHIPTSQEYCVPEQALKLLVVEDHPIYLEGLSFILKKLTQKVSLKSVHSTSDARMLLSEDQNFDLVLLDLGLPDGGGISVLKFLRDKKIFIPVVVLSASEESRDVQCSLKAGASGFISKASGSSEILAAITGILSGDICVPDFYNESSICSAEIKKPSLTPRQNDVLRLVIEGLPNKGISRSLNLTEHTVKSHMKALFSLLNVHNRTECARVAIELSLLDK